MGLTESDVEIFLAAFKLVCRKCGSDDCVMTAEPGINYGGRTGYQEGLVTAGCNSCRDNDVVFDQ